MPSRPPSAEVVAASMTNCRMIAPSLAPSALRMPISRVRSVEVYVGFLRKKLASIGSNLKIEAIRRLGYHLEAEE